MSIKHKWVSKYLKSDIFLSLLRWMRIVKKYGLERGGFVLEEGWKCFKKGGSWQKKGVEKNRRGGCDPQRNYEKGVTQSHVKICHLFMENIRLTLKFPQYLVVMSTKLCFLMPFVNIFRCCFSASTLNYIWNKWSHAYIWKMWPLNHFLLGLQGIGDLWQC